MGPASGTATMNNDADAPTYRGMWSRDIGRSGHASILLGLGWAPAMFPLGDIESPLTSFLFSSPMLDPRMVLNGGMSLGLLDDSHQNYSPCLLQQGVCSPPPTKEAGELIQAVQSTAPW